MKPTGLTLLLLIPVLAASQNPSPIASEKYSWKIPREKQTRNISATTIFSGSTNDMEYLQMDACLLASAGKKTLLKVPANEEYLFIVKSGLMQISFRDSDWSIGRGSVSLLLPGEKFALQNSGQAPCLYYLMKYRSRSFGKIPGQEGRESFVRDWNALEFKPHDKGGVRRYFEKPTAMCKRFEMHVSTLNAGLKSHDPHTHRAAEIILVMDDAEGQVNKTEMQIGDKFYKGEAGDLYYLGSNILHGIRNDGVTPCTYFAFQFE